MSPKLELKSAFKKKHVKILAIVCRRPFDGTPPVSLGDFDPTSEWKWADGDTPEIRYNSSEHCVRDDNHKNDHYRTQIKLTCDREKRDSYPTLIGKGE